MDRNDIVVQAQIQGVAYILTAGPGINPSTVRNPIDNPNAVSIIIKPVSVTDGKFSIKVSSQCRRRYSCSLNSSSDFLPELKEPVLFL